jgi:hypothetical protein
VWGGGGEAAVTHSRWTRARLGLFLLLRHVALMTGMRCHKSESRWFGGASFMNFLNQIHPFP